LTRSAHPIHNAISRSHSIREAPVNPFQHRRERLLQAIGPRTAALFIATPVAIRNNDVEHDFRQDSDVFYLTGFDEPEAVAVLTPHASVKVGDETKKPKLTMFVRPRDPEREVWDGYRAGLEGAKERFGADLAFPIDELPRRLPELLIGHDSLVYRYGRRATDEGVFAAIQGARRTALRAGMLAPLTLIDPLELLHEHRLRKGEDELAAMRRACAITNEAHRRAMAFGKPGRHEYELEALILETFRKHGSERPAYGSIVGSGENATVLHYRKNDRKIDDGDLVLIDAGCEYGYYASDVTRTFPANGRFSDAQREVYETVLESQLACCEMTKPGVSQGEIHDKAVEILTRGLVKMGVLVGELPKLIEDEAYKPFYMHKTGHWLGMDVHDVGAYFDRPAGDAEKGKSRGLEPGMVITIEPGLYFGIGAEKIPEKAKPYVRDWSKYRGIGVRIEDDVLCTKGGSENLTRDIPKSVREVEAACRG
jgi:Xaa-Pro aminopeptidase